MKLRKLSLANYRNFEQIDIEFEDDVTVIAGVNGVGKSGILKAIAQSVSHVNLQLTPSKEKLLHVETTDVTYQKISTSIATSFEYAGLELFVDINKRLPQSTEDKSKLEEERDRLRFLARETEKGSKEEAKLEDALNRLNSQLGSAGSTSHNLGMLPTNPRHEAETLKKIALNQPNHPISVLYSTKRALSRLPPRMVPVKKVDILSAYRQALLEGGISAHDFSNWYRFIAHNEPTKDSKGNPLIFQQLEKAFKTFLPDMSDLQFHEVNPPKFSLLKNGKRFFLEQLSDGEVGLLALIFDLTRRLATANPKSKNPIAEGAAIVLIDEVELHLHPLWQRQVIHKLKEVFKNCQFIATTHSPQVIGETPAESVRLLTSLNGSIEIEIPGMAFGADSNWILNVLMEAKDKNEEVNNDIEEASRLISKSTKENLELAEKIVKSLRNSVGNTASIQRLASLIERKRLLGR